MALMSGKLVGDIQYAPKDTVLLAGGGPVCLLLARVLSFNGVESVLFERNETTTKWPKVDHTNPRSMELFRKLGRADALRKQGVPGSFDQNVLISSGLSADKKLTCGTCQVLTSFASTGSTNFMLSGADSSPMYTLIKEVLPK